MKHDISSFGRLRRAADTHKVVLDGSIYRAPTYVSPEAKKIFFQRIVS